LVPEPEPLLLQKLRRQVRQLLQPLMQQLVRRPPERQQALRLPKPSLLPRLAQQQEPPCNQQQRYPANTGQQ
jgi:hypothetical protein